MISGQKECFFGRNLVGIFSLLTVLQDILLLCNVFFFLTALQEYFIPFLLHTFFSDKLDKHSLKLEPVRF